MERLGLAVKGDEIAVVIVAAGRGERAGASADGPKQYRPIRGMPVIRHTLEAFANHPRIDRIVVAIHPDDEQLFAEPAGDLAQRTKAVHGCATRQESTLLALR